MKHLEEVIINYDKKLMKANIEIERLNNIINEAIEYIEKYVSYYDMEGDLRNRLLEILKGVVIKSDRR